MVGIDPATGALMGSTISEQTRQAVANCRAVLVAAGADLSDVVEVGVLLTDSADFDGLIEEYTQWFGVGSGVDPPARYVARLGVTLPDVLVSIRLTACSG
ncbi:MAG: putative endoribonuclease [Humibacillus sp.]|nr:putative endoribonuclease [Humibacillus sp.]